MKRPAIQFYPGDWRKDPAIQALGYFDRGVWFEMLCLMHESSERGVLILNGNPMPTEALANALGLDNQILTTTLTKLCAYGVAKIRASDGALYSKRMVEDDAICSIRRRAGQLGGNPNLVKQIPTTQVNQNTTTQVKQIPTPSSSSSSSDIKETAANAAESEPAVPARVICPYREIAGLYHEVLPELPRIAELSDERKRAIKCRWLGQLPRLESWRNYFGFVRNSKFLMGQTDPSPGRKQFRADIDFLIRKSSVIKISEGKYHD